MERLLLARVEPFKHFERPFCGGVGFRPRRHEFDVEVGVGVVCGFGGVLVEGKRVSGGEVAATFADTDSGFERIGGMFVEDTFALRWLK